MSNSATHMDINHSSFEHEIHEVPTADAEAEIDVSSAAIVVDATTPCAIGTTVTTVVAGSIDTDSGNPDAAATTATDSPIDMSMSTPSTSTSVLQEHGRLPLTYAPKKAKKPTSELRKRWKDRSARYLDITTTINLLDIDRPLNDFGLFKCGPVPRFYKADNPDDRNPYVCEIHNSICCIKYQIGFRIHNAGLLTCLTFDTTLTMDEVINWFQNLTRMYYDILKLQDAHHPQSLSAYWSNVEPRRMLRDNMLVIHKSVENTINEFVDWMASCMKVSESIYLESESPTHGARTRSPYLFSSWDRPNFSPLTMLEVLDTGEHLQEGNRWKRVVMDRVSLFKCHDVKMEYDLSGKNAYPKHHNCGKCNNPKCRHPTCLTCAKFDK